MRSRHFYKIIKHDLTEGIRQNALKYILSFFLFSLLSMMFFSSVISMYTPSQQSLSHGSFMDCAIYIFRGMNVYIPSPESPFMIPITWLTIQVMAAFLIVSYPTQDLHSYGVQILTRTKTRGSWWISKCVWNIFTTILFYSIGFIVIMLFALIFGKLSLFPGLELNLIINEVDLQSIGLFELVIAVFLLPVLTTIAISLFQMTLSFILTPILSYLITVCVFVSSAYFCLPVFIGNFSMLLRNQLIYPQGSSSSTAIIINISIIVISIMTGYLYFKRYDILKKR